MQLKVLWSHAMQTIVDQNCCLKRDRCRSGSQWRSCKTGSDLLAPVTTRVAAFWTTCSLCNSWLLTPASRLLQLSSRLLTKACTRVLVASDVSDCLIALSRRKWKKQNRLTAATWLALEPSSRTPRSLTTDENGTVAFCNFSVWNVTLSSCWRVGYPARWSLSSPSLASGDCWPSSQGSAWCTSSDV